MIFNAEIFTLSGILVMGISFRLLSLPVRVTEVMAAILVEQQLTFSILRQWYANGVIVLIQDEIIQFPGTVLENIQRSGTLRLHGRAAS